ncbi:MAG: hypothetical protein ACO1PZ_03660 [Gammaproteobacteria bacterium]
MKARTGLLLAAPLTLLSLGFAPGAFAKNQKVEICHATGSATNPSVLLNVSVNAAAAHYGHGDPLDFEVLPNGRCVADSTPPPPPPPPPPAVVELTACSRLDGSSTLYFWAVDYYPATGAFDGVSSGSAGEISGTITPAGDIMEAGKTIEYSVDELSGVSTSASTVVDLDPSGGVLIGAYFRASNPATGRNAAIAFAPGTDAACNLPAPR